MSLFLLLTVALLFGMVAAVVLYLNALAATWPHEDAWSGDG